MRYLIITIILLILSGCTINIAMTNGNKNIPESSLKIDKNIPINTEASLPLLP